MLVIESRQTGQNTSSTTIGLTSIDLSIDYVAQAFATSQSLEGLHRHARDQWLRAAQSIPLNIAEGNGKRSLKDRARFLDIARGSALECAAIQDVLVVSGGLSRETDHELKSRLVRIVAMLTRMAMKFVCRNHRASTVFQTITSTSTAMLSTSTMRSQSKAMETKPSIGRCDLR